MAKIKGISHAEVMAKAREDPEFVAAYEEETRKELLQAELERWRKEAGLTSAQVAEIWVSNRLPFHVLKVMLPEPASVLYLAMLVPVVKRLLDSPIHG